MNNQTKELAEQAGCVQHEVMWVANNFDIERFADLVRQDERERLKAEGRLKYVMPTGCKKQLAQGQWWNNCGDSDYGSMPALCTECGGEYKLAFEDQK